MCWPGLGNLIVTRAGSAPAGAARSWGRRFRRRSSEELRARIRARPGEWLGQEIIEPSTVPTLTASGSLEPRPAVLRTFSVRAGHRRQRQHRERRYGHGLPSCPEASPGWATAPTRSSSRAGVEDRARTPGSRRRHRRSSRAPGCDRHGRRSGLWCGSTVDIPSPVGWLPSSSFWDGPASTPNWSSGSSAPSSPGSTSPSASEPTVAPSRCRSCWPLLGLRSPGPTR